MTRTVKIVLRLDGKREIHVIEHSPDFHAEEIWTHIPLGFLVTSYRIHPSLVEYPNAYVSLRDTPADIMRAWKT